MKTTATFRKEKHRQKHLLIDKELDTLSFSGKSPIHIQVIKLSKSLAMFQVYRSSLEGEPTVKLARDICKTAKKYGLLKYCIEPSEFLFQFYAQNDFNRAKALKMKKLNIESNEIFRLEQMSSRYYSELLLIQRSKHSKSIFEGRASDYWENLKVHLNQINSFSFHKISFMIGLTYYKTQEDWLNTETLSRNAINYFESFPLKSNRIISIFYRQHINAILTQGKEDGISELLETYKSLVKKDTSNWFLFQFTLARIKLIKNEYAEAKNILQLAATTKGFRNIANMNKLAIEIAAAYGEYSLNYQKPDIQLSRSLLLAKEEDMFSEHYRLQLLIIRLIYFCHHKQWKLVESNSAAVSKFLSRKLIRKDQGRSYNFINMLLQLSKQQYHPVAIERHTSRYHAKLLAEPCRAMGAETDYEIIPYERLWEMIMDGLKR